MTVQMSFSWAAASRFLDSSWFISIKSKHCAVICFSGLAVSAAALYWRKRCENAEKKNDQLQHDNKQLNTENIDLKEQLKEIQGENAELKKKNDKLQTTMNNVKGELENQKHQHVEKLKEVENERRKNKKELQSEETKITDEGNTEDKESFLRRKEDLLTSQWKLDENKKLCERQILNTEKVLEPIEMLLSTQTGTKEDV
ncbi:uncharacterized protein LOC129351426 [Poeciliopsis prolifica]|uniref:uncharacterized protein LOC129351426 n=1 Tax=Poeciliopsis prolifica TaxID=188132 RepID=UPI002413FDA8|nr:uncharacterized protein LOC129351426 [Poeciliopsis prolifica]